MSTLHNLGLTADQHTFRADKITASFAPALMAGDADKITREWKRLVDAPDYEREDLSMIWAVQFGSYIEAFALDWHQRKDGRGLSRRGETVRHPTLPLVSCTLDAYRAEDGCVIDCKAPGKWRKLEDVLAFYPAQLVVQRACVGAERASLLVVHGGAEPEEHAVEWDADYERAVWERIAWFQECVESLTPPIPVVPMSAPLPIIRTVDMRDSNAWAEWAPKWLANRDAAKTFATAEKELKAIVPQDAKITFGHSIEATRNAKGAISIKQVKS